ncbi:MAG: hypothetical protein IVW53_13705 [Chloroflexi bacterium]|nr:hypothetical protein [Chloroflexota bacterium]
MTDLGPIDRLVERASTLAGAWGARARRSTTPGQERALLRLFGVHGLDRAGRPLAGEVVDRYVSGGPSRLAGGVVLPFCVALLEYELGPQEIALEVAAGTIDLGLEAESLEDGGRRAAAETEASRLGALASARIDANRTARRELLDLLGDAPMPWLGMVVPDPTAEDARRTVGGLVRRGADLLHVEIPVGRELAMRLSDAGLDVPGHDLDTIRSSRREDGVLDPGDVAPAGSQRGLTVLRRAADEAAAERRRYVRLATVAPGLAAPEQAVVAAFERIDVAVADVVAEIVDGRVDPDRALADHAFALRLHRRAGSLVVVGAGPLVVGPDLASGIPSSAVVRAGRALALQVLGVALARDAGLPAEQILAGALPGWLIEEPDATTLAIAQAAVRRAAFRDLALCFTESATRATDRSGRAAGRWGNVAAATVPFAGRTAFVALAGDPPDDAISMRTAMDVAAEVATAIDPGAIRGPALDQARDTVVAALRTIDELVDRGWRAVLGEPLDGSSRERLGAGAVVERSGAFDPIA